MTCWKCTGIINCSPAKENFNVKSVEALESHEGLPSAGTCTVYRSLLTFKNKKAKISK